MKARIEDGRGTVRAGLRSWSIAIVAALALGGCAGDDELIGATTASATTGASPLVEIERDVWTAAPAGCEGMLDELEWDFGVAAGAPELVVVLDPYGGAAVCTDTYSAVDAELRATGSEEVDRLWLSYVNTLQEMEVYSGMTHSSPTTRDGSIVEGANDPALGEPNPQPNRPGSELPDLNVAENEPNPQPNMPSGSEGGEGSSSTSDGAGSASSADFQPNTEEPTEAVAPTVEAGGL